MSSSPIINSEPAVNNFDPTNVKTEVTANGDGSQLEMSSIDSYVMERLGYFNGVEKHGDSNAALNNTSNTDSNAVVNNTSNTDSNAVVNNTSNSDCDALVNNASNSDSNAVVNNTSDSNAVKTITTNGAAVEKKTSKDDSTCEKESEANSDVYTITKNGDLTVLQLTKKAETITLEPSKYSIRKEMWKNMDKNGVVSYPRPCRGRIPNFRSAREAADKLKETEAFKNAQVVKVNTDKPQEMVRFKVLEGQKRLVVSPRRSDESSSLVEVKLPSEYLTSLSTLKKAVTSYGMRNLAQAIDVNTPLKIDLIVVGSVAVSRSGQRIGKCDGFTDLEFGYLTQIGAITEDTIVATTVHEAQVFETLPEELFSPHDFALDLIVTPTEVIEVANRPPRIPGIVWAMLSKRRLALYPKMAALHQKLVESGKEVHLKEEDTDAETERDNRRKHQPWQFHFSSYRRNPRKSESKKDGEVSSGSDEKKTDEKPKKRRPKRLRKDPKATAASNNKTESDRTDKRRRLPFRRYRVWRPLPISFSIRIGGIAPTDTVRHLKNALAERNLKPAEISWFGPRGFAFVHFAKPKKEPEVPIELETVLASLQDMKLGEVEEGKEKAPVVVRAAPSVQVVPNNVIPQPKIAAPTLVLDPVEIQPVSAVV